MGRGLSELQRFILKKAAGQKRLHYAEVLVEFFGWQPEVALRHHPPGSRSYFGDEWEGELEDPGAQYFSRRTIGEATYRKVMATLSRSCRRLQDRGLVTCLQGAYARWAAVSITEAGRQWLSVNTQQILPQC
jgi:hypothetical protein